MQRIPILSSTTGDDDLDAMRDYYRNWRKNNSDLKSPFFALFKTFKDQGLLKDLDEGALRLYLYFGLVAGNEEGTSWHSIQTIADYFGNQTRTIDNWIKKLVDAGLIYRTRDNRKSNTTFLVPYTDALVTIHPKRKHPQDDQELLDDLVRSVERLKPVYGSIEKVFHIFHWGWDMRSKKITRETYNIILIITKREDGILVGHRHFLRKSADYGISEKEVEEVVIFNSPFVYKKKNVIGLGVNHQSRLRRRDSIALSMQLMKDLAVVEEDELLENPRVKYGLIDDLFDGFDEDNDEEGGD